ncbi:Repeat domain-containing protein, partial [Candidatus Methanophagaceae archaeon]
STHAEIITDLEGDGNPDVLVHTLRYDPVTDIGTEKVLAKKGSDGSHLWEESVTARGENNSYIIAHSAGDLDGDGLDDVIVIESEYDKAADTETAKVIAKIGKTGMPLWEESVNTAGEDNSDIFAVPTDDLDGDCLTDVIVIESIYDRAADTTTAKVIAKNGKTGMYLWEESVNADGKDNCDIDAWGAGDLNGDGLGDIIVIESIYDSAANATTAKVIATVGNSGTYIWEETVNANGKDNCDIDAKSAGDLDADGLTDVIVIESIYDGATDTTTAKVIAKKGNTGTRIWEESVNADGKDNCDIDAKRAGDLDGDGFDDVIVRERKSNDAIFTATMSVIAKNGKTGTHMWEESVTGMVPYIYVLPAGDLDGDGLNDVIVSEIKVDELTFTATMCVIAKKGSNGASLWEESVSGTGSHIFALSAGNLDGDGLDDVIVIESTYDNTTDTTTTRVIAKNGKTGSHMWEESVSGAGSYIAALPAGDLDGDGLNDVIATENKYNQPTDTTTTRVIAKTGKEGTHLLEAQSNELIWVATWWGHNCDLNGDGTNDLLLGISTEMYALTCLYGTNTFDTCQSADMYPSIPGTHTGTIAPNQNITVQKLYTYPCAGTGGHTESVRIYGNEIDKSASWNGYAEDRDTITFDSPFTLESGKTYNYVIETGSYPQIHHTDNLSTPAGFITCSEFRDVNGKRYSDWIPAIRLT